jgi:hypothetical protein
MSGIGQAKQLLPLPELMERLGLAEHAKKSARCPSHDDQHNSFSVWQTDSGAWRFKCHAGCGEGDEITFLQLHKAISRGEAIKLFLKMAGVNGARPKQLSRNKRTTKLGQNPLDWRACVDGFTEKHVEWLAKRRGYSIEFCSWLKEQALIGLHNGRIAFPVHDQAKNVVAVHYQLEDGSWRYYPQGVNVCPLVIGEPAADGGGHVFESQWDAFAFMDRFGK